MPSPSPFTFVGVTSAAEVASGNLTLVTTGVTIQTGDLVIACIAYRSNAAFAAPDASWQIVEQQSSGNTSTLNTTSIASAVMMVVESWPAVAPSLVFGRTGGDVARGVLMVYRAHLGVGALNVHSSETLAANGTTGTTPSITTTTPDELLVAMAAGGQDLTLAGNFRAATDPTNSTSGIAVTTVNEGVEDQWLPRHSSNTVTGADTYLGVADAVKSAVGATGEIRAQLEPTSRHAMIVASFKSSYSAGTSEQVSKASRYDVLGPADDKVSLTKLSRYDILMPVGTVSITKFSRYDILQGVPDTGTKRRVQNVNYH